MMHRFCNSCGEFTPHLFEVCVDCEPPTDEDLISQIRRFREFEGQLDLNTYPMDNSDTER